MSDVETDSACPSCAGSIDFSTDFAIGICQDCGLVLDEEPPNQSDVKIQKEDDENQSQESDHSVTVVDWQNEITPDDASDQQLMEALSTMDRVATELGISSKIRVRIAELVTAIWEKGIMFGRSQDALIAACILIECQNHGEPRPLEITADLVGVDSSKIHNSRQVVRNKMELDSNPTKPADYLIYLQQQTEMSDEVITEAERLLNNCDVGGDPAGIAIAAIYLSAASFSKNQLTYVQAAKLVGLTKETIWKKADSMK